MPLPTATSIPLPVLRKELRTLAPALGLAFALFPLTWLGLRTGLLDTLVSPWKSSFPTGLDSLAAAFVIRFAIVNLGAAAMIGNEFEERTFERRMSEPVPRLRHWTSSLATLGGALLALFAFDVLWILGTDDVVALDGSDRFVVSGQALDLVGVDASILLWALFGTTTATLLTRRTYTGFVAGMLAPVVFIGLLAWAVAFRDEGAYASPAEDFWAVQIVPLAALAALGAWRIRTMEVSGAA